MLNNPGQAQKPSHPLFDEVPRGDPGRNPWDYLPPGARFTNPLDLTADDDALWEPGCGRLFLGLVGGSVQGVPGKRFVTGGTAIGVEDNRHICTFAGSRAGKGRSVIVPNMLHYPGSVLATDPKGELAAITARRRHGMGQKVHVLDPFASPETMACSWPHQAGRVTGFNPILAMRKGREVEDAALIGDALVLVEGDDPHWDESARAFIEGVILHVATWPDTCSGLHSSAAGRDLIGLNRLTLAGIIRCVWLTLSDPGRTIGGTGLHLSALAHARWD